MMSDEKPVGTQAITWWDEPRESAGSAVRSTLDQIKRDQDLFRVANLTHMRMYRNLAMVGLGPHTGFVVSTGIGAPLSLNVVRNMCNAVQSKITKNRPRPWFQTSGATYKTQQRAQKLEQYANGVFYQQKVYRKTARSFLDSVIFGTGVMKVLPGRKCVEVERVFTPEVVVDNVEGMHGEPRNIYQYKYIDRGKLIKDYPALADELKDIPSLYNTEDEEIIASYDHYASDLVRVEEAYHTASEEGANDGLYVKTANGITLEHAPWAHDWHPYLFMRWSESPLGHWGMGLAEELRGIQLEINRIVKNIQGAMVLLSNPYVLADRASNISRGHITDVPGSVIEYTGKPPSIYTAMVVHPEVYNHLKWLIDQAYGIAGISQLTAQSQSPKGFTSGRAQLVHSDQESERFANVTRVWEDLHMDLSRLALKVSRTVSGIKVKSFGDNSYKEIDFKKDLSDIEDDDFVLQAKPTSMLGDTPEANIEMGERLTKAGLISEPSDVLQQIDHPDFKALVKRKTASRVLAGKLVQSMLDGGAQQVPIEEMNLAVALSVAQEMYVEAKLEEYTDEALSKVRAFMQTCVRMQTATGGPAGAAAPQLGAPGAPPPGAVPLPPNGFTPGAAGPVALPPNGFTPGAIQ